MSSDNHIKSDEYVAKLLAEDARNSSIKYSSMGLSALLPKRPTNSAPKPNTRFLQNVLRETDSHNAALKKKEDLEARLRLKDIRDGKTRSGEAEGRENKKRRRDMDEDRDSRDHKRRAHRSREEDDSRSTRREGYRHHSPRRRTRDGTTSCNEAEVRQDRHRRSSRRDRDIRRRSSSPDGNRHHRRRRHSPSDSSRSNRHRSRRHKRESEHKHSRTQPRKASPSSSRFKNDTPPPNNGQKVDPPRPNHQDHQNGAPSPTPSSSSASSSSDPLESILGPLPPPRSKAPQNKPLNNDPPPLTSRGRGSYRPSSSTIDTHFSSTYDPTLDLQPASSSPSSEREQEDWDMALEALRDRELWKKKGAERLREAGFAEEEVRRWEESGNGKEKGVEDVRWRGQGEVREWDAGKVVECDAEGKRNVKGKVGLEAAWKRRGGGFVREMKRALG